MPRRLPRRLGRRPAARLGTGLAAGLAGGLAGGLGAGTRRRLARRLSAGIACGLAGGAGGPWRMSVPGGTPRAWGKIPSGARRVRRKIPRRPRSRPRRRAVLEPEALWCWRGRGKARGPRSWTRRRTTSRALCRACRWRFGAHVGLGLCLGFEERRRGELGRGLAFLQASKPSQSALALVKEHVTSRHLNAKRGALLGAVQAPCRRT